jgi:hypothetical protein
MSTAAVVMGVTGLASAGIGAGASLSAAGTQANAALSAEQLQYQAQQEALDFQKQQWAIQQQELQPFLQTGTAGLSQLAQLLGVGTPGASSGAGGFGSLMQGFGEQFQAPTMQQAQNEPGYQFQLQEGERALQNSAAASGSLLSGGSLKGMQLFGQQSAQGDYQNVYNRALQEYQQRYNIFSNNQSNQYNRLAGLAGIGQQTAGQLGQLGNSASQNVGNILLGGANSQAQSLQNAAAARASGYVGAGNAINGGIGGIGQLLMMQQLLGGGGGAPSASFGDFANAGFLGGGGG